VPLTGCERAAEVYLGVAPSRAASRHTSQIVHRPRINVQVSSEARTAAPSRRDVRIGASRSCARSSGTFSSPPISRRPRRSEASPHARQTAQWARPSPPTRMHATRVLAEDAPGNSGATSHLPANLRVARSGQLGRQDSRRLLTLQFQKHCDAEGTGRQESTSGGADGDCRYCTSSSSPRQSRTPVQRALDFL
jgi:hypothetical protein